MSDNHSFVKYINLLCVIQLSIFLVSCGGDDEGTPSTLAEATVTASEDEGFAPLNVTFDVRGPEGVISGVTWDFGDGETAKTTGTSSISHTFVETGGVTVSATINVKVDPTSPSGDLEVLIPLTVFPDVNLIVSSFAIDTEVTPGSFETISAIIQNIGTNTFTQAGIQAVTVHIDVGYYLSTDNIITVDDIFIGDTSILIGDFFTPGDIAFGVQELAPGENYQYDHQLAVKGNVPAGTYFAGAIVDYLDEFDWYTFPRSTDTFEFTFPSHIVVPETDEDDNVRLLPAHQVVVIGVACVDDQYDQFEGDDSSATATLITVGDIQVHNFCFDNSDWLQFDAVQGNVYKITTSLLGAETDTQLILYDTDGSSILLFHDNIGNVTATVDLEFGWPADPASEIVWEAQVTGTYFIKVRTTTCDEDKDFFCESIMSANSPEGIGSPDGVGLDTGYSISLQ